MNLIFLECFPNNGKLWLAGADVVVLCFFFLFRFRGGIFENILYLGRIISVSCLILQEKPPKRGNGQWVFWVFVLFCSVRGYSKKNWENFCFGVE